MGTVAVGVIVGIIVVNAVRCVWKDRQSGKSCASCGGGCGGCSKCRTKD